MIKQVSNCSRLGLAANVRQLSFYINKYIDKVYDLS